MIVIVASGGFSGGSVATRALQEAHILKQEGWDVTLVVPRPAGSDLNAANRRARFVADTGISVIEIADWYLSGPFFNVSKDAFFNLRLILILERIRRRSPVCLVIVHASPASYPVAWFCRRHRIPSVFVIHALIWDRLNAGANPYGLILTTAYRHANAFALRHLDWHLANSTHSRALAIEHGARPERVRLVYNCVDERRFRPAPGVSKAIDVLFVGRLSLEKGIDVLAGAIEQLPKKLKVCVVGDGPMSSKFERRMRTANCNVTFLGWIKNEQLPSVIQSARLQVVPSLSEPQGLVVAEAMACGVPVIGSRAGGIPEMIQDGCNGWLVAAGSSAELAAAITAALSDPVRLQMVGENALKSSARFTLERLAAEVLGAYRSILETPGASFAPGSKVA